MKRAFLDSNVLIYSVSRDDPRRARATSLIEDGAVVSVQCLDEFCSVALRKLKMTWETVDVARDQLITVAELVVPLTLDTHFLGLLLAQRYSLSVYDGMIVSAALQAGCETLWSEDMQDGLVIGGRMTISNPFRAD